MHEAANLESGPSRTVLVEVVLTLFKLADALVLNFKLQRVAEG